MGLPVAQHAYELTDKLVALYRALRGSTASGYGGGDGTYGASLKAADIDTLIAGGGAIWRDSDIQIPLGIVAAPFSEACYSRNLFGYVATDLVHAFSGVAALGHASVDDSIIDLDTFMAWYNYVNAATYWQALAAPEWRDAFYGVYGGSRPRAKNLYFQVLAAQVFEGVDGVAAQTFTNALGKRVVGGAFTDGFLIDTSMFAGGFPYVQWTGGAGAGSSSVTVTGKDENGAVETYTISGTWGAGDFIATQPGVPLIPSGAAHHLISDVTAIATTGFSAGTIFIEARRPSGRTYPPT